MVVLENLMTDLWHIRGLLKYPSFKSKYKSHLHYRNNKRMTSIEFIDRIMNICIFIKYK